MCAVLSRTNAKVPVDLICCRAGLLRDIKLQMKGPILWANKRKEGSTAPLAISLIFPQGQKYISSVTFAVHWKNGQVTASVVCSC